MSLRCGFDAVFRTFLLVSFVAVRGSGQTPARANAGSGGNGGGGYRAPTSCPSLPGHCSDTLPWACKPKTRCVIKKSVCPSIDSNSSTNAVNLTKNIFYYNRDSNKCWQALNLTWIARPRDYDGFLLRTISNYPARNVFNQENTTRFVIDKYKHGIGNGTNPMLFYYDCLRLAIASSYRFELYGLRNVPVSRCLLKELIGTITLATNCDTYPEADSGISKWTPYVNPVLSNGNSTMKIYFTPAPRSFRFSSYHILLLDLGTQRLLGNFSGLSFTCTSYDAVVFDKVCSGNYSIQIFALDAGGQRCIDCSIRKNVQVTGSEHSCLSEILLESPSFGNSTLPTLSTGTLNKRNSSTSSGDNSCSSEILLKSPSFGKSTLPTLSLSSLNSTNSSSGDSGKTKIMVIVVVLLAFFIGATVTLVMLSRICKGVNGASGKNPSVLLIYAKDNEYHCNVVQRFASYLQQRCHCDVKLDLWCPDEISKISALDWLLLQIQSAGNIIIVNSEGAWRQYEGAARYVTFERIRSETPLQDMFLLATKELQNRRIFKVAFPYTDPRYFIGDAVRSGRTYALMNDIEDLFLGIQQLSKHSVRGKKLAFDINASSYTKCKEGRSLAAAVKEAGEFHKAKPEWFSEFYFQKDPSEEDCQPSPVYDSGFEASAEYVNSTSEERFDDGTHGFTFYPPSDLGDNASSVSGSNIEELFALVNNDYDMTAL